MAPGANKRVNTGKAGKILLGVGLGAAALGGALAGLAAASADSSGSGDQILEAMTGSAGGILLGLGGLSVIVSIPLIAVSP